MKTVLVSIMLLAVSVTPADAKVKVVATISDLASIAEQVGGERIDVDAIADGSQDLHYVELLPSYMLKVRRADLLIKVGLDLDLWSFGIVDGANNPNLQTLDCSHGIDVLERPTAGVSAKMGDIHVGGNPHYWLDPANGLKIARSIASALVRIDPEGEEAYRAGLADFSSRLSAKMAAWKEAMVPFEGSRIVYFHNAWPYFNGAFGLEAAGFIEPKPGINPSPGHTAELIRLIQTDGIRIIAMSAYFNDRVPRSIERQTGARVVKLASSVGGVQGADDYISLFETNLARIRGAFEEER